MTTKELNDYIFNYSMNDKTRTAIMLTGDWGSGKSYYIEHELVPFLKNKEADCVVVSLYGIEDVDSISKNLYMELRMKKLSGKKSEALTTGKVVAKSILKNIASTFGVNTDLSDDDLNKIYKSVDLKNKLVVFEDFERSNVETSKLLGYINGLVEQDGVKVLVVANENEILFGNSQAEKIKESDDSIYSEEQKKYLRIKEKTISDTIQFEGDVNEAVENIVELFADSRFDAIFTTDFIERIVVLLNEKCKNNLRTFSFAIQKSLNLINIIENEKYETKYYQNIINSIIVFSSKIKASCFPKWEGNEYLSTELGSNEAPLLRFTYDYIRWHSFDLNSVDNTYKAYKEFCFYDEQAEKNDCDLRVLNNYAYETESNVLIALKNIEKKLENPQSIGISAYWKLAYYMIYVGTVVGFDYQKSCDLMVRNIRGLNASSDVELLKFFANSYEIDNKDIKEKYSCFVDELIKSMTYVEEDKNFSYQPCELKRLYNDLCTNKYKYIKDHKFISKYNAKKIVGMLVESSAGEIDQFRGVLFAVYRNARKGQFDEKDVVVLKKILDLISKEKDKNNSWDKIQLMQIDWLKSNLNEFIKGME